jgi:hypothetical protein
VGRRRLDDHLHCLRTSCSERAALKVHRVAFREFRCKYVYVSFSLSINKLLTKSTKWTASLPGRHLGGDCVRGGPHVCMNVFRFGVCSFWRRCFALQIDTYEAFWLPKCYASSWIRKVYEAMSHYTLAFLPCCACQKHQIRHHLELIVVPSNVKQCEVNVDRANRSPTGGCHHTLHSTALAGLDCRNLVR